MSWVVEDVLALSSDRAEAQWQSILARQTVPGGRQVDFLPVEVVLCLVASLSVDHRGFGGSTADRAPTPVPELSALFQRPPSSVLAKMANLDGTRPHGAKHDKRVADLLLSDPPHLLRVYAAIRDGAHAMGIDARLPEMARLPLLPRWVGTPMSGAIASYLVARWDRLGPHSHAGREEPEDRASPRSGAASTARVEGATNSAGMVADLDATPDEAATEVQESIAELLVELSESRLKPNEVRSDVEPLALEEVRFDDGTWFSAVAGMQDWIRLDQPLDTRSLADGVRSLAVALAQEDWTELVAGPLSARMTSKGLEVLRQRLERAVQLRDAFVTEVEIEGSSSRAATGVWIAAWEEADELEDVGDGGTILAEADVWPISDIKAHAEKGRLELSPSYQRGDVWPNVDAQKLIESILRGIPLPSVILLRATEDGRSVYEVIDGKQRLTAILRFTASHPGALAEVRRVAEANRDPELPVIFRNDYPAFRRRWQEVTGEALTAARERSLYFPFKLRSGAQVSQGLGRLQGKYYSEIKSVTIDIAGLSHEVADIFETNATKYKLPMITYDDAASPHQIHEVFSLYNKQGKHLNAEEIRNARYHRLDLMRGLLAMSGDTQDPLGVAPFLAGDWSSVEHVQLALNNYGLISGRYQKTKVLSWVASLIAHDSVVEGRVRQRSTAAHINTFLDRVTARNDPLRNSARVTDLLLLIAEAIEIHREFQGWPDNFRNSRSTMRWQELPLVASWIGTSASVLTLGKDAARQRMTEVQDLIHERALGEWSRPSKTQTAAQWRYIASIVLDMLDIMDVDPDEVDRALKGRFGESGMESLTLSRGGTAR